jgi:hypothetical protein
MPLQEKNNRRGCSTRVILLPIIGALFLKKPISSTITNENTLDFHLQIVQRIDELFQEHKKKPLMKTPMSARTIPFNAQESPVELRPQLGKHVDHIEIELSHVQGLSPTNDRVIPEEFKIDSSYGNEPEFRFITKLDSIEHVLHIAPHQQPRVEIIDLGDVATDEISSHLKIPTTIDAQHFRQKGRIQEQQSKDIKQSQTKKIEIIDAQDFMEQTSEDVFLTALKQNEEIEKKSQIYYLKAAGRKDEKATKKNEQSYVPEDFEERARILREKQEQEEEQRRELEEKIRNELEKEEQQKRELEEKVRKQVEKEQEKLAKQGLKKIKTEEKKGQKIEVPQPSSEVTTKKQLKEQQHLEKIAARKAKVEERLKLKKEKKLLKEQQKHLTLAKSDKKGKYVPSEEIDSDVKKILQITDALLGELPEEVINRFMQSDDFELYEHILNKYKIR